MRAVKKDGRWEVWGLVTLFILAGASRLLPEGATSSQAAEQQATLAQAVQVAAGKSHTCAITSAGWVMCWGDNAFGQLGDGSTVQRPTPVYVVGLSQKVLAIGAGEAHTCALTQTAEVKCWGANGAGQLGNGNTSQQLMPVGVFGLSQDISAIAVGGNHTCALSRTAGVRCWGQNTQGELGDNSLTNRLTPVSVLGLGADIRTIATGEAHTCALTHAGGVKCWGYNGAGQVGDGSTLNRIRPVDVTGLTQGIHAIAVGGYHTCAITLNSWVKCWGYNGSGQLGDGGTLNRPVAVDVAALNQGVIGLAAGKFHTCAFDHRSSVKCWGGNVWGALGDGSKSDQATPTEVLGLNQSILGLSAGESHTCALTGNNGILCWGANDAGQLGDNSGMHQVRPVYVSGLEGKRKVYLAALLSELVVTPDPLAPLSLIHI
ncbi:MAG: RCC1 repeat-containing protein, partial [Anaerolineae bacterium]|nr:RCC1 repeat-containing protein [Anaerolineae bacterium]